MSLLDAFLCRPLRKNVSVYQSDEFDSGLPSSNTSSCYGLLKNELKNEIIRSENRRSALADSLKNAYHAIEYQKNCLEQQDRYITSSKLTLESLLMRQELLDSRFSNLKHSNIYPDVLSLDICEKKEQQSSRYLSELTNNSRINALEREIIDIKEKMRSYGSILPNNYVYTQNVHEDGKDDEAEAIEVHEVLRRHSAVMEAKSSSAQQERDVLELQVASLHSGLHQEKVTSKRLEKECVKLQSQVEANRNINENLHLEVSALKQHNHTLENAVKGSENENKSLHVQVKSLQNEKQVLASQKELLFEIMKKKEKRKYYSGKLNRRTPELIPTRASSERSYSSTADRNSLSELTQTTTSKQSRKKRRRKDKKYGSEDQSSSQSDCQTDCDRKFIRKEKVNNKRNKEAQNVEENKLNVKDGNSSGYNTHKNTSKRSELNTDIIVACYQHLADLLSKLESLKMNNVGLDNEKEQILKFLLRTIQELQDCRINSENSIEQVEELLNERMDLRKNYHKRINQVTAVIIELNHLRQAYNGVLRHSQDPDDKKAMQWISRVQAIKDALKLLQEEQSLNQ